MKAHILLSELLKEEVENKFAAGVQLLVSRDGQNIFYSKYGYADIEKKQELSTDTIYRMYSMTKPVTAVMASVLQKQGKLNFNEKVSYYFPEFKKMYVVYGGEKREAKKEITLWHLLHMTSGIVYPDADEAGRDMQTLFDRIHMAIQNGNEYSTQEIARMIGKQPLAFEPGSEWRYGLSADVLGAIMEKAADKPLAEVYKEILFDPLNMSDTGFFVPENKQNRLATLYKAEGSVFCEDKQRHLGLTCGEKMPEFISAGAGLYSTMEDYAHFLTMLAQGGVYQGNRILDESTVESFGKNALSNKQRKNMNLPHMRMYGYSQLMRVYLPESKKNSQGVPGEFGWDGWTGPYFSVDRKNKLFFLYVAYIPCFIGIEIAHPGTNFLLSFK